MPEHRQGLIDVDKVPAPAFSLTESLGPSVSSWHVHRKHQLLYSSAGTLYLETQGRQWLLPPQRAAWVPAGCQHRVRCSGPVSLRTIYIDGALFPEPGRLGHDVCTVFPVTALLREMILHGMRWGPGRDPGDAAATRFFVVCADVCARSAAEPLPLWLPTAQSKDVAQAMEFTMANLGRKLSLGEVAKAAAVSERTLARRFAEECQTSWRDFVRAARLLRAMELLSFKGARVGEVAAKVGFDSVPAFTRAFERLAGESPKDFRRRRSE